MTDQRKRSITFILVILGFAGVLLTKQFGNDVLFYSLLLVTLIMGALNMFYQLRIAASRKNRRRKLEDALMKKVLE